MRTRIIVDSTADLMPEILDRVHVVPLTVHFGEEELVDGVTIDKKTFYERLVESDVLPSTSQATPEAFMREFEKAKQAGEQAVVITVASKLSGTYQSAVLAAREYEHIHIVDTKTLAGAEGYLVQKAIELRAKGLGLEEIKIEIEKSIEASASFVIPADFEFLKRSGRLTPIAAKISSMIKIVPVMTLTAFSSVS